MSSNSSNEVWLVIDSLTFGGIETHVFELAKGLKHFDITVKVLFLRRYSEDLLLEEKLISCGITVEFLNNGVNYLSDLIERVKTHRPALLHAHGYKASLACKLVKLFTGVRQISTYHAGETPSGRVWLYDWLDRYSSFISTHSIVVSKQIAEKLPTKSVSFNNFIDTDRLISSQGSQIAFVGRLSHEKGPDRFIQLAHTHPSLHFHVYGSGPDEQELQRVAPDNVQFHGHQKDMNSVWPNIGALIICSRFEGLPMTALEAMARGIPVLSLNVGNMPHLIDHQVNGFIVENMLGLDRALTNFLALDCNKRSQLKRKAIDTVQLQFSQTSVIPQILKLYFPPEFQSDCQFAKQNQAKN